MVRTEAYDWNAILSEAVRDDLCAREVAQRHGIPEMSVGRAARRHGVKLRNGLKKVWSSRRGVPVSRWDTIR